MGITGSRRFGVALSRTCAWPTGRGYLRCMMLSDVVWSWPKTNLETSNSCTPHGVDLGHASCSMGCAQQCPIGQPCSRQSHSTFRTKTGLHLLGCYYERPICASSASRSSLATTQQTLLRWTSLGFRLTHDTFRAIGSLQLLKGLCITSPRRFSDLYTN